MAIKLFDLAGKDDALRFSPFCWRAKMALRHKGLPVEEIPWRFTEKDKIAQSGQGRVPVLVDGETWIHESWKIACHLDERYPDRPALMATAAERASAR
ncbi:MAG: glutathione S-transferase N-terminal domain-containing protein, partial [Pseudomonadota bacterium]|nr:glutathione S-transferase N-terminal domain-containing protein [Pseudomonadota bacterium]